MLRFGVVTNIDINRAMCRVEFKDVDAVISYWLPVMQQKTLQDKHYWMPDLQEHVVCLMDKRLEEGVILGAVYSMPDKPPVVSRDKLHIAFNDGTTVEYDRAAHHMQINVMGTVDLTATGEVTMTGALIHLNP